MKRISQPPLTTAEIPKKSSGEQLIADHRSMFELAVQPQRGGLQLYRTDSLPNQQRNNKPVAQIGTGTLPRQVASKTTVSILAVFLLKLRSGRLFCSKKYVLTREVGVRIYALWDRQRLYHLRRMTVLTFDLVDPLIRLECWGCPPAGDSGPDVMA